MKTSKCFFAFSAFALLISLTAFAGAGQSDDGKGGGDGEVPYPFSTSNQHAELADGELYTLYGRASFIEGQPHLTVDLEKHPWLASESRKNWPHYRVDVAAKDWADVEGQSIQVFARARSAISVEGHRLVYELRLEKTTTHPIIVRPTRPSR